MHCLTCLDYRGLEAGRCVEGAWLQHISGQIVDLMHAYVGMGHDMSFEILLFDSLVCKSVLSICPCACIRMHPDSGCMVLCAWSACFWSGVFHVHGSNQLRYYQRHTLSAILKLDTTQPRNDNVLDDREHGLEMGVVVPWRLLLKRLLDLHLPRLGTSLRMSPRWRTEFEEHARNVYSESGDEWESAAASYQDGDTSSPWMGSAAARRHRSAMVALVSLARAVTCRSICSASSSPTLAVANLKFERNSIECPD